MTDEKSPLSSAVLLTELNDKLDRMASAAAQGSLHMARAVRILDARGQLDARTHTQLVDEIDKLRRNNVRLEKAIAYFQNRPASLTVVQDVPREEDITGVFIRLPGMKERKKVPTKVLVPMMLVIGAVVHWFGAQFPEIWKWATSS